METHVVIVDFIFYFSQIFITYVDHDITFSQFEDEMREICGFQKKV